jgi:outer membrane protein
MTRKTSLVHSISGLILTILLVGNDNASAQGLLDYLRNYDLNDYALGVSMSGSQSPYVGGENSLIAYPILTSFRDSAFTDDWLLIRDGDVGIRYVTKSNWELGLVGRVQTLGLGTSDSLQLIGLDDRKWGLELAPILGYRGWPVHINFKTYTEVFDHHDGWLTQLAFSLPLERERGYLVPSVELIYQGEDYANYYYGVSPSESNVLRPAYQAADALNTAVKLRWGYALTDKWLVYGSLGLEFLDSEITNSPIVDRDELFSASISVAYNNNIFQPRISDSPAPQKPQFEFRLGAFNDSIDSTIVRDSSAGIIGTDIDLENLLGLDDEDTILHFDAIYRIGTYHRLELGYLATARSGQTTLQVPLDVGDTHFPAGTVVDSHFDTKILRIGYAYSLINDAQKEVGIMGGLHFPKFSTEISAAATGQSEISNASTPLPVIGLHGSVALGEKSTLGARIQFFRMDFHRYEGSLNFATLDWQYRFSDTFSAGLAYNYYALNLDSRDNDVRGSLEIRHHGPELFLSAGF